MKNTRENVIELLQQMRSDVHNSAQMFKDSGDMNEYHCRISEAIAYYVAISLLSDEEFFNNMYKIHKKD